jgi:inner membrane protein
LRWFTKGFYKVWQNEDEVVMTDLRMGAEPSYVFSFVVGHLAPEQAVIPARRLAPERDFGQLKKAWCRIWSENIHSCS